MTNKIYTSEEMLSKLISFNTVSDRSNMELIEFIQEYLEAFGIKSTLLHDEREKKANLYATIGHTDQPGVILSGHTDVVPVEGQDWDSDPFDLREQNGRLYGRGTCDMKGFIAVTLAKIPELLAANIQTPIHLAFSYDEEIGCLGAHKIAEHVETLDVKPKFCIVGEPTMMKPITGHKGVCDFECTVHGHECHSSLAPYGVNAVEYAAELVSYAKKIARRLEKEGPYNTDFTPPHTTVHTGIMKGGTAVNIVPNHCEFELEIRAIPEQDPAEIIGDIKKYAWKHLEPMMKDIDPKSGFEFKGIASVPAFDSQDDSDIVTFVKRLSGSNNVEKVSFATEAGIFQNAGVPTVVCGPGSIEQAHRPNEFVAVEQLRKCESFFDRMIEVIK